jgi:hypothetical protein
VKTWWMSYLTRQIERAIIQLYGMNDRELQDLGYRPRKPRRVAIAHCAISWRSST